MTGTNGCSQSADCRPMTASETASARDMIYSLVVADDAMHQTIPIATDGLALCAGLMWAKVPGQHFRLRSLGMLGKSLVSPGSSMLS